MTTGPSSILLWCHKRQRIEIRQNRSPQQVVPINNWAVVPRLIYPVALCRWRSADFPSQSLGEWPRLAKADMICYHWIHLKRYLVIAFGYQNCWLVKSLFLVGCSPRVHLQSLAYKGCKLAIPTISSVHSWITQMGVCKSWMVNTSSIRNNDSFMVSQYHVTKYYKLILCWSHGDDSWLLYHQGAFTHSPSCKDELTSIQLGVRCLEVISDH